MNPNPIVIDADAEVRPEPESVAAAAPTWTSMLGVPRPVSVQKTPAPVRGGGKTTVHGAAAPLRVQLNEGVRTSAESVPTLPMTATQATGNKRDNLTVAIAIFPPNRIRRCRVNCYKTCYQRSDWAKALRPTLVNGCHGDISTSRPWDQPQGSRTSNSKPSSGASDFAFCTAASRLRAGRRNSSERNGLRKRGGS